MFVLKNVLKKHALLKYPAGKFGVIVAAVALLVDQVSKWYLVALLAPENRTIEVLPFFNLVMWWNKGISFGLFSGHEDWNRWALILLALGILCWVFIWLRDAAERFTALALGLVIGGALGNVIDRLHWGAVADFFLFYYKEWYWPAFNVADSCIFVGVMMLCVESLKGKSA